LKRSATENRLGDSSALLNESGQLSDVSVTAAAEAGLLKGTGTQNKKRNLYFDSNDEICFGDEIEESETEGGGLN
jgi:hypothetical protein